MGKSETYVEVGPMAVSKDTKKVPKEFAGDAPKVMRAAAIKGLKNSAYTPKKPSGAKEGFYIDATLTNVTIDEKSKTVSCEVSGVVATYPKKKMLTAGLSGKGKTTGTGKADVEACVDAVLTDMVKKKVVPFLDKQ